MQSIHVYLFDSFSRGSSKCVHCAGFYVCGVRKKKAKYVCYSEFDIGPISDFAVAANFILS